MPCAACGTESPTGARFCMHCAAPLSVHHLEAALAGGKWSSQAARPRLRSSDSASKSLINA